MSIHGREIPKRQKSTVHPNQLSHSRELWIHSKLFFREKLVIVSTVVRRGLVCSGTTAVSDFGSGNGSKG